MDKANLNSESWIVPEWPAPSHVRAVSTTRLGGQSQGAYASFNLATHVGDDEQTVHRNRQMLGLPEQPAWLEQVHSDVVVKAEDVREQAVKADAIYTLQQHLPCVVMTADCLPLLVTDQAGQCVAAIHAGWRGLVSGIIENTLQAMPADNKNLMVWLGPAIGAQAYEVGDEVRQAFIQHSEQAEQAFTQVDESHWLMDIYQLARQRLYAQDVQDIYGGDYCTFSDAQLFYSYRRDGITGRMASIIWLD